MFYFGWSIVNFDNYAQVYVQQYLNTQLKNKNMTKLKAICADKQTYNFLKNKKYVTVKFTTDNQGGGNSGYYSSTISSHNYYFITLKINSVIPNSVKLTSISYYKD